MENLFNHAYPYLDEHELNLDWVIAKMKELNIAFNEFKVVNNITFSGEWDITKNYPAWTIVNDNNIGYVSIQPVPVGIVLTNTDYWVEVIDYSTQIAGLQNRVVNLENDVAGIHNDITGINNDIADINRALAKKYIFVGDSYGTATDNWIDMVVDKLNLTASDYYKIAAPSRGFRGDPAVPGSDFLTLLQSYSGSITNPDEISDIVVGGGINDVYAPLDPSGIESAIHTFCSYCRTTYPNAKIHIGYISFTTNVTWLSDQMLIIRAYNGAADTEGYAVMDNIYNAFHYKGWMTDAVHPNVYGMTYIANMIANHLIGGGSQTIPGMAYTVTYTGAGILSGNNITVREFFDGHILTARNQTQSISISATAFTCTDGWQDLATLPTGSWIVGDGYTTISSNISLYESGSNTYYKIPCEYRIYNNKLQICCPWKGASGVTDKTITVTQVKLPYFTIAMDAICN